MEILFIVEKIETLLFEKIQQRLYTAKLMKNLMIFYQILTNFPKINQSICKSLKKSSIVELKKLKLTSTLNKLINLISNLISYFLTKRNYCSTLNFILFIFQKLHLFFNLTFNLIVKQ